MWLIQDFFDLSKRTLKLELTTIFVKQDEHKHDENAKE